MTFEPRVWDRNGALLALRLVPRRVSVALFVDGDITDEVAWLTEENAGELADALDRMFADPPATYGDGSFGGDE